MQDTPRITSLLLKFSKQHSERVKNVLSAKALPEWFRYQYFVRSFNFIKVNGRITQAHLLTLRPFPVLTTTTIVGLIHTMGAPDGTKIEGAPDFQRQQIAIGELRKRFGWYEK